MPPQPDEPLLTVEDIERAIMKVEEWQNLDPDSRRVYNLSQEVIYVLDKARDLLEKRNADAAR